MLTSPVPLMPVIPSAQEQRKACKKLKKRWIGIYWNKPVSVGWLPGNPCSCAEITLFIKKYYAGVNENRYSCCTYKRDTGTTTAGLLQQYSWTRQECVLRRPRCELLKGKGSENFHYQCSAQIKQGDGGKVDITKLKPKAPNKSVRSIFSSNLLQQLEVRITS